MKTKKISKSKLKKLETHLEKKTKKFEEKKEKFMSDYYSKDVWTTTTSRKDKKIINLPNPFDVVVEFIKDKGLKLYGGQALHEHLKKYKEGFYKKSEFPDYDVFSPNAWEHAKELANIFYNMGFDFSEARGSILNDDTHQTYKVGVDMMFILDLTQAGCTPARMRDDCSKCGLDKNKKCFSVFNHMPANDLITYNPKKKDPKVYRETYDFKNDRGLYPKKFFVCDKNWLKISMFRELSEPLSNPQRLKKVGKRLSLFENYFEYNHKLCTEKEFNKEVRGLENVLKYIGEFVKKNKLINFGASAHNIFVKNNKFAGNLHVSDYKVYTGNKFSDIIANKLRKELSSKFKNLKFKVQEKIEYWKEIDTLSYSINVSNGKKIKYNNIITFVENETCMPYIQYNGIRYVTVDRLKYLYFRAVSLPEIYKNNEENPQNYECLLSDLLKVEELDNKKRGVDKDISKLDRGKFRRYSSKCEGDEIGKIIPNLTRMWNEKMDVLKKTKYIIDAPKENMVTKIYPLPKEELKLPFKPMETRIKSHIKYHKNLSKKYKKKK